MNAVNRQENGVSQVCPTEACNQQRTDGKCQYVARRGQKRSGTILIVVLVCLAVVSTILFGAVKASLRNRGQIRTEVQMEQTYWLLDAGIDVAIAKFGQDSEFSEHEFTTDSTLKNFKGRVDIKVIERNDQTVRIRVTAKLQGSQEHSQVTRRSRVFTLEIPSPVADDTIKTMNAKDNKR